MQPTVKQNQSTTKPTVAPYVVKESTTKPVAASLSVVPEEKQPLTPQEKAMFEVEEVDDLLAKFLTTADFVVGNGNQSTRQLNAALGIVNHANGKRLKVQKDIVQKLDLKVGDFVQATTKNQQVILLKSTTGEGMQLKAGGYLYSSELVEAITKEFAFDFSNQSTHHLMKVTYKKWNSKLIAIITP